MHHEPLPPATYVDFSSSSATLCSSFALTSPPDSYEFKLMLRLDDTIVFYCYNYWRLNFLYSNQQIHSFANVSLPQFFLESRMQPDGTPISLYPLNCCHKKKSMHQNVVRTSENETKNKLDIIALTFQSNHQTKSYTKIHASFHHLKQMLMYTLPASK